MNLRRGEHKLEGELFNDGHLLTLEMTKRVRKGAGLVTT